MIGGYFIYQKLSPYIYAVKISKIAGKKTNITKCNTKDYVIINKDKSYTMSLTNETCEQTHYEGDLYTKDRSVIFEYIVEKDTNKAEKEKVKQTIIGTIDQNYDIIINNNLFKGEKHNERTTTSNTQ